MVRRTRGAGDHFGVGIIESMVNLLTVVTANAPLRYAWGGIHKKSVEDYWSLMNSDPDSGRHRRVHAYCAPARCPLRGARIAS